MAMNLSRVPSHTEPNGVIKINSIFLDYNATTPLASEVLDTISFTLKNLWANPSSSYQLGKDARKVVEESRTQVASMIGAKSEDIIFTSGGTEANHMIITSVINKYTAWSLGQSDLNPERPHIITSNLEHDSIILLLEKLRKNKTIDLTIIPVCTKEGRIRVKDIQDEIRSSTCLVTVMMANNETGIIQPIASISEGIQFINTSKVKEGYFPVRLHTDAAQAIGKVSVNVIDLNVDFLTIVGHKFYGPRIGAVFSRNVTFLEPYFMGGGQERGYRAGTENTGMIAGLGKAAELVQANLNQYHNVMKERRGYLECLLVKKFGSNVRLLGARRGIERIPNTCSVAFIGPNCTGKTMLEMCEKLVASVGAACHSNSCSETSGILLASGVPEDIARNAIRLSVGRETTKQDIDDVVEDLYRAYTMINVGIKLESAF